MLLTLLLLARIFLLVRDERARRYHETPMPKTRDRFETINDALTALDGTKTWEWGGLASYEGWCRYARQHAVETYNEETGDWEWDETSCLADYLRSVREDPAHYDVGK